MNDMFIRAQRIKITIESELSTIVSSQEYSMANHTNENILETYKERSTRLKNKIDDISLKITEMKSILQEIQNIYGDDFKSQSNQRHRMKLENMMQTSREIEQSICKVYKIKNDKLREEKDKLYVFGNRNSNSNENNDSVGLLIEQSNTLNKSHALVEDSLNIGQEVLLSFNRQSDTLKRMQSKVNNIIGDMGLSQGIIKLIGSRDTQDKRIIIFLTSVLLVFIFMLYYTFQ